MDLALVELERNLTISSLIVTERYGVMSFGSDVFQPQDNIYFVSFRSSLCMTSSVAT